jgi:pyruvate/2-oxoglutarate/acetoin dehydrogenase E1 component
VKYVEAIRQAIYDSMKELPTMTILGQGVWSPFYVGRSMDGIESEFGRERVIDTPVSENAVTGIALGSALMQNPTLVIHPRMDFMILAMDPIVNAAAKWRYALNWQGEIPLTIRAIINRGGEQGAQHSQSLQSWFAHIPGLRVVMPSSPRDAYFLLKQSLYCPDPVLFIEDRWSYEIESDFSTFDSFPALHMEQSEVKRAGDDVTIVGIGHSTNIIMEAAELIEDLGLSVEVIDLRVLQPLDPTVVLNSVSKTRRLIVVDGAWRTCGMASEIVSRVVENIDFQLKSKPIRITLPDSPAPTSSRLEKLYYPSVSEIVDSVKQMFVFLK